jgi:hypothetical protein
VNWYYSNQEQLQQVEMAVLEDQVVDHVLEKAAVEPVKATYPDVVSGKAIPAAESEPQADSDGAEAEEAHAHSEQTNSEQNS